MLTNPLFKYLLYSFLFVIIFFVIIFEKPCLRKDNERYICKYAFAAFPTVCIFL